jgi:hypothetical protein
MTSKEPLQEVLTHTIRTLFQLFHTTPSKYLCIYGCMELGSMIVCNTYTIYQTFNR